MSGRDPYFLLALVAYAAAGLAVAPGASLLGFLTVLALLRVLRIAQRAWLLPLTLCFLLCGLRALYAEQRGRAIYAQAVTVATPLGDCSGEGEIVSSPQIAGRALDATARGSARFYLDVEQAQCAQALPPGTRIDLRVDSALLHRGDRIRFKAKLAPLHLFDNPGSSPGWVRVARSGTAISGYASSLELLQQGSGLSFQIDRARAHVRSRIEATYHPQAVGLARALVLGETDLDEDIATAFRRTGLAHILAVSGTHLVVTVLGIERALRAIVARSVFVTERIDVSRVTAALALPLTWAYSSFAGGSGSVFRAACMMTAHLLATVVGRRGSGTRSFTAALVTGLVVDPMLMFDASFTLSAAATFGLLALSAPLARLLGAEPGEDASLLRRAWAFVAKPAAATLAATLTCAPMTAALSGETSAVGIVANLIAAPIGELFALPFAILHAAIGFVPACEQGAALVAGGSLRLVAGIASFAADLGGTVSLPSPSTSHVVVFTLVAVMLGHRGLSARTLLAAGLAFVAVELGVRYRERGAGQLRVTALDVAQGDAILIEFPNGQSMLIDGGGLPGQPLDLGTRVVRPVLRAKRRTKLDVVVLSHPHPDHFGGLGSVLETTPEIGEFWDGGTSSPATRALREKAASHGATLREPSSLCGAPIAFGGAQIEVLHPCRPASYERSANDGSLVLKITYGARSFLFTGDAEREAEHELLEAQLPLQADVLKIGHHGSRTSSTLEWLEAVKPSHAVISCGIRNRFGHPHGETMETLWALGVSTHRTDLDGAWVFSTDGAALEVRRANE
jgi:competence protein ComEC